MFVEREQIHMTKATGLCTPYNDGYENGRCTTKAQTVDGRLFIASIQRAKPR